MGWFVSMTIIVMLVAFNLFTADAMMRMRSDIQVIRRAVSKKGDAADGEGSPLAAKLKGALAQAIPAQTAVKESATR
jgi:hypothetical protein